MSCAWLYLFQAFFIKLKGIGDFNFEIGVVAAVTADPEFDLLVSEFFIIFPFQFIVLIISVLDFWERLRNVASNPCTQDFILYLVIVFL